VRHHEDERLTGAQALHVRYFLECCEHWRGHGYPESLSRSVAARDAAERHPLGGDEMAAVRRYLERRGGSAYKTARP
jgi:hypothetical protein